MSTSLPAPWRNRIVGYGAEAPDQLLANPKNWRIHSKPQQDALRGVLHEVGVVQDVLVNRTTGFVVDGHLRVALALADWQPSIPVTYVELTEAEENLVLATFDPIAALAGADRVQLDSLLREVSTDEVALQALLAEVAANAGIAPDFAPVGMDEQGRLDEKAQVTCPACGHAFTP